MFIRHFNHFNPLSLLNYPDPFTLAKNFIDRFKQIKIRDVLYAGVILTIGLAALAAGQGLIGCGIALYGTYEFYKILYPSQNEIRAFLKDAKIRLGQLAEKVKEVSGHVDSVEQNHKKVEETFTEFTKRFTEIENLATHGHEELEKQKQKAAKLYKEAEDLHKQAKAISQSSKEALQKSEQIYTDAFNELKKLQDPAQIKPSKVEEQKQQFNTVYATCETAQENRKQIYANVIKANDLYRQAFEIQSQARDIQTEATNKSLEIFKKISLEAQIKEVEQKGANAIAEMKKDIGMLKKAVVEIGEMVDGVGGIITQADQAAAQTKVGVASVAVGTTAGAFATVFFGPAGTAIGTFLVTYIYHYRKELSHAVNHSFVAKGEEAIPAEPTMNEPVTYAFNPDSTGVVGHYLKRERSHTHGKVAISVTEKSVCELAFDLNSPHKITDEALTELSQIFISYLELNPELASHHLRVLNNLETIQINRGDSYAPLVGFINSKEGVMKKLRDGINKVLESQLKLTELKKQHTSALFAA